MGFVWCGLAAHFLKVAGTVGRMKGGGTYKELTKLRLYALHKLASQSLTPTRCILNIFFGPGPVLNSLENTLEMGHHVTREISLSQSGEGDTELGIQESRDKGNRQKLQGC